MRGSMEVVRGTLDLIILKTLSPGVPLHGFGVLAWVRDTTEGDLVIEEGALYPALHRMEQRGLIQGEWRISEKGRRAKYYSITPVGRKQLKREESEWLRYVRTWELISAAASAASAVSASGPSRTAAAAST